MSFDNLHNQTGIRPYWRQLKSILRHKWHFMQAGRYLGVSWRQIITHDLSKFSPVEFINYSRWCYGIRSIDGWAKAWLHHLHHNKHHPEYWVLSWRGDQDFYNGLGKSLTEFVTVLPMPEQYVREMVADFMAASKMFTDSYDIAVWLNKHGPAMNLHDDTVTLLHCIMIDAGYFCTDNCDFSFMAGNEFRAWAGLPGACGAA